MLFRSLCIAFSMYSKIPVPNVKWDDTGLKYAMCFFPLVGVVLGMITYIVGFFALSLNISNLLLGCIMSVLPMLLTGGIHFDGFLDTMDGISSYGDIEKRLNILKDSNSGAFAVIGGLCYFTLSVGFCSYINLKILLLLCIGYVLSRALSALSVVTFPLAKNTGLLATFSNKAHKRPVAVVMIFYILGCITALCLVDIKACVGMVAVSLICYLYHYINCIKNFGGITGDLSGYFLQICELSHIIINVILLEVII